MSMFKKMFRANRSSMRKQTNGLFRTMSRPMIRKERKLMGYHGSNRKSHQVNCVNC